MAPGRIGSIIGSIKRKPSTAPDRKSDADAAPSPTAEKTSLVHDITHLGVKNTRTVAHALTSLASGAPLDDKELLLENGVSMLQSLPLNSSLSSDVSDGFIKMLYHDLPHPPATISGPTARYRRHDGGNNCLWNPEMGKAGTPYSRSVPPMKPKGPNLPDPELVYEQLLKRTGPFRPHPTGLNRMFFSFATIVIHECFQTSRSNQWINETSSYVDLSTLYGNTEKEQKRVRTYQNGLIHPDSVASERIMLMPPGVIAVLIMFSRNHNSIAESLLSVNEDGMYRDWDTLNPDEKVRQDEDIFQLSRNINVGFFATVVLKDYVAAILNTPRANSYWSLDLGGEIKSAGSRVERGTGNVVSVEFAVLYHWHAALSAADADWMENLLKWNLPDLKSMDDMTVELFGKVLMQEGHKLMSTAPKDWTFNNLKRGSDGRFSDEDLAEILKGCVEEPAHAFGAHGSPHALKVVEIMGQLQARDLFKVCTMNEFRKYLNLKPYASFEDWNPDKETARAAELLYGHIDNLELYPGLMAECTKPAMPGSGVCPGQTTGRGILDDAVGLIRGDRFLSYDFNSSTLTNWGVGNLGTIPPGAYGGMLPKLLFQGLPAAYTGTSPYALLPFYTPKAAAEILKGNKAIEKYDLTRPRSDNYIVPIQTAAGCKTVFGDPDSYRVVNHDNIRKCTDGNDYKTGWDSAKTHEAQSKHIQDAFFENDFEAHVTKFFREHATRLVKESSLHYPSTRRSLDVVRDVTNVVPILWLAERFALPLKTERTPHGLLSIPQVFGIYLALFQYQNNVQPGQEWRLREASLNGAPTLRDIIRTHLRTQQGIKEKAVDWLAKGSSYEVGPDADRLYHALNGSKRPLGELVGDCLALGAPIAGNLTIQGSLLVDLFLRPEHADAAARISQLAHSDDAAAEKELQGYALEGMRLAAVQPGVPRVATKDGILTDGARGALHVRAGQTVLVATSQASLDPAAFPNPQQLDPHRPVTAYDDLFANGGLAWGFDHRIYAPALAATLRAVFGLKNVRRAPGKRGVFTTVPHHVAGLTAHTYLDANSYEAAWPTTLSIDYDE